MRTLAEFLVDHIIDKKDFSEKEWIKYRPEFIQDYSKAIEAYKNHLRNDSPKTVHWAMIEKDLITALERMQSWDSLEGARHNNQGINDICVLPISQTKYGCDSCPHHPTCEAKENNPIEQKRKFYLANLVFDVLNQPCPTCKRLLACTNRDNRHCDECGYTGNCERTGYGTKSDNRACDRFKLNVVHLESDPEDINYPICPLNMYFEGDEDEYDVSKCDFKINGRDSRSCTETCKKGELKCRILHKKKENN